MKRVQGVEQRLADDLKNAEFHDFGFVMFELGEPMIKFRAEIELEVCVVSLAGLHAEPRQVHRALQTIVLLCRIDLKAFSPNRVRLPSQGNRKSSEKLITRRHPLRSIDALRVVGTRRMLPHAEKAAAPGEPTDINPFSAAPNQPNQTGIARVVVAVNPRR